MEHSIPELPVYDARYPTISKAVYRLKICINEYCKLNSISGLLDLGFFPRIFWTTMLVVLVIGCYFTNLRLFEERHILIVNEEKTISTYDIPFPAVTVCTTIKADHRKFNFSQTLESKEKEDYINRMILKRVVWAQSTQIERRPTIFFNLKLDNIHKRVKELGIQRDDLIASCSINRMACNWSAILTPDGLCYTFNMASPDDMFQKNSSKDGNVQYERGIQSKGWTHKNGYENRLETNVYPVRGIVNNELKLRLQININDLENSRYTSVFKIFLDGFFVYVGHPMDYPHKMENKIFVPLNSQYVLKVFPDLILADKSLIKHSIKSRNCLIDDPEWKNMKVFNQYSMNNCLLECIGKMAFEDCGCYPFYVPGYENATCGQFATDRNYCYNMAIQEYITKDLIEVQHNYSTKYCNCTQPCSYLAYDVFETFTGILHIPNDTFKFSDVTIRLASSEFIPKRRQESRSDLDMLAAIGSALGLFIGASVISIIEIVYYSVKIWVKFMMWKE